jgi:hypothetical protein
MSESRLKNRKLLRFLAAGERCIYCPNPAETVEHMPPVGMFRGKQRPGAMEFPSCKMCNEGTRGADAVAQFMARLHPDDRADDWHATEAMKLIFYTCDSLRDRKLLKLLVASRNFCKSVVPRIL